MVAIIVKYNEERKLCAHPSYNDALIHNAMWNDKVIEVLTSKQEVEWFIADNPNSQLSKSVAALAAIISW